VLVAFLVVDRQSRAREEALALRDLEARRGALEVQRAGLMAELHRARSRAVLVPLARDRLGLRLPQDSEIVILQEPRLR
jgi:hypothetical protein